MNYTKYAQSLNASDEVIFWIKHNLVNHLSNNQENQDEIEHIIDYLVSDKAPKRLRGMSYKEALSGTKKWVKTLTKKGEAIKETKDDIEVILDFKDGFKIVKLIGKNAYEREGFLMRHCVGSYYGKNVEIYSLRDKNNMPHCTMEKDKQVKGKGNGNIHPKYIKYVVKFLEHIGMTVDDNEMKHLGYMNVSKIKKYLHKDTKYFNKIYLPEDKKLLDKKGEEFFSLDLLDIKPLIKESDGNIFINFNLSNFIKKSIDFLKNNIKKNNNSQLSSSGDHPKLTSSSYGSKLSSSGDYSQLSSSGDNSQLSSSGCYSQLSSSSCYSKLSSSGDGSKLASSGDNSQLSSSGCYSQLSSSSCYSQLSSSGDYSQLASSGDHSQLASSSYGSKLSSSSCYSQLSSSGNSSKLSSSGCYSQLASSGDGSQLIINNEKSVGANIGMNGKIKGVKGTWITLAEYDNNNNPIYVKSAQIDGKKLKENTWYKLKNKKFVEVD